MYDVDTPRSEAELWYSMDQYVLHMELGVYKITVIVLVFCPGYG